MAVRESTSEYIGPGPGLGWYAENCAWKLSTAEISFCGPAP